MRFFPQSGRRVSSPSPARKQQLMQSLEPRRLMAMTGEFDLHPMQHADGGDMQINHAFEHSFSASGNSGTGFGQPMQPIIYFNANLDGPPSQMDPQTLPGMAAATGSITSSDTSHVAVPVAETSTAATTLSAMYSSLDHSTVAQIDAASTQLQASAVVDDSVADDRGGFTAQAVGASPAVSQSAMEFAAQTQLAISHLPMSPAADVTSDTALAHTLSAVTPAISFTTSLAAETLHQELVPTWSAIHRLEDEFTAVRTIASQVVSEIGRDGAIALSHLESLMESESMLPGAGNTFSSWRSVAMTGAVIAGAAYAQSKTGNEKKKAGSVFSQQLIEIIRK